MVASEQIAVASTIGILPQPFSVHDVAAKLGLPAGRVGLTMNFFGHCGLVTDAPGRGMYWATSGATQVAEAWAKDAELGKAALRKVWNQTWFTKSARNRLAQGAGLRDGLHARFTVLAGGNIHRRSIDKLVDLMVLAGLLIEERDGFVRWYDNPAPRSAEESSSTNPEDTEPGREGTAQGSSRGSSSGPHSGRASAEDPSAEQGRGAEDEQAPSDESTFKADDEHAVPDYEDDPAELLADPLLFGYVRYMTPSEAADLYRQLHGVLGILAQARACARADDGTPPKEFAQPLQLSDLGRLSLENWLDFYAFSRKISTFIPSMRSRQSTPQS